jgi:hypothetical protein
MTCQCLFSVRFVTKIPYNYYMKYLVVLCILFCTLQTFGQQDYFIYLQTDNNQPFYVRIHNNVYSSSSTGYCNLTKLADSIQVVTVGFARNVFPEQQFNIPVNHKDAGYVLKNFADKGWALVNLQSQAVIMSSTIAEEKKKPEISGVRRTDAFSSLLANAVNDTAVLYTLNRPPKPVPAPIITVVEEKKRDTTVIVKKNLSPPDSSALVKKLPVKKDSSSITKNILKPQKDTGTAAAHLPKNKEPAVAKNRKPVHDTVALVKKDSGSVAGTRLTKAKGSTAVSKNKKINHDTASVAKNTLPPVADSAHENKTVKKDSAATVKNSPKQKKDTVTTVRSLMEQLGLAKSKKERKDTIILMNGKKPGNDNLVAKNTTAKKEKAPPAKDTVQVIKKEILQAPEEKRNALLNNNGAVVIETVPVKKDTASNAAAPKKDSVQTVAANETNKPADTKPDTLISAPVKRLRPLVTKVAELLTDTSYIAVFVDESKEKFDTIRISIPFNETAAFARQNKPAAKQADSIADKITKNDTPAVVTSKSTVPPVKIDTAAADTIVKNNTAAARQNTAAPVKPDSTVVDKKARDSSSVIASPTIPTTLKKDTTAVKPLKDSIPVMANREPAPAVIKKDSLSTVAPAVDSARGTKTPAQALFLNSDCKEIAVDSDIDKLRIKMLLVTTDEDRITLAKRLFRQKCFLVRQVKALSELFKSDEGKYKWFDAVYSFVSDTGNFSSLGELIKDDYYLNRFKAMLRH